MGMFVRVGLSAGRVGSNEHLFELYELVASARLPVVDYWLIHVQSDRLLAHLTKYPRWTEPGLTLFYRLLRLCAPEALPDVSPRVTAAIQTTARPPFEAAQEYLQLDLRSDSFHATYLSAVMIGRRARWRPVSKGRSLCTSIGGALCRVLDWGRDPPEMPLPLSEVPVQRTASGRELVRAIDIPEHARAHFIRCWNLHPATQLVDAGCWRDFIGNTQSDASTHRATPQGVHPR